MPLPLPDIAVLSDRTIKGANSLSDESFIGLKVVPWASAFNEPWMTDAHFCTYQTSDPTAKTWPRMNKPILSQLRGNGMDLLATMLVLDYDTPGHVSWTADALSAFLDAIQIKWDWTLFYTTRNGARFVYVLDAPIPVDVAEAKHIWLCQEFARLGIAVDQKVSDWTRIFRLPFVMRATADSKATPTWESELFFKYEQPDNRLVASTIPSGHKTILPASSYAELKPYAAPKPDETQAMKLIEYLHPTKGDMRPTEFAKEAKRRLKGRECYDCLFNPESPKLAEPGERNPTLHKYVGQAVSLLYSYSGTTPQAIYGLFLPAVQQLEPDNETPDWTYVLWDAVCRLWSKEQAKERANKQASAEVFIKEQAALNTIIEGMKKWDESPELKSDQYIAEEYARRKLIVSFNNEYYMIRPDGNYEAMPIRIHQVLSRIKDLRLDDIIQLKTIGKNGAVSDIPAHQVLSRHQTIVKDIRAIPCLEGGMLENPGTDKAVLNIPCYSRSKEIDPCYSMEVDEWLTAFFGDHYSEGIHWIAWALAFEEGPIAALSITGPPGIGKKMLVQGLAECLTVPRVADGSDLTSDFNYALMETPFLNINEGWPDQKVNGQHPADAFRSRVTGDPFPIKRKFLAPIEIKSPLRIIFTANSLEVVRKLFQNRELSTEERNALAIRLVHYHLNDHAERLLRGKGGMNYTGKEGHRWIAGDSGQPSDFVIARHFMWLYQNRGSKPGGRLLVEGNNRSEIIEMMRTQSGASPLVIEALIKMIESNVPRKGLVIEDGKIYVIASEVMNYFRQNMGGPGERLSVKQINEVFRGLVNDCTEQRILLKTRPDMGKRSWHNVEARVLYNTAMRDGWECGRITKLLQETEAAAAYTKITGQETPIRFEEKTNGQDKSKPGDASKDHRSIERTA